MIRRLLLLFLFALLNAAVPRQAQAAEECGKAGAGQDCQIVIDRSAAVSGRTVTVENGTKVTVVLIKQSPFESCKNDVKREELPDVSAVPTLLGLVKDLALSLTFPAGAPAAANSPEHIAAMLDELSTFATTQLTAADTLQKKYEAETKGLKAFYRTTYRLKAYTEGAIKDETAFEADRGARESAVATLDGEASPNTAGGEATYKAILAEFTVYARSAGATPAVISMLETKINRARTMLDALDKTVTVLDAAHTKLHSTLGYLQGLQTPAWQTSLPLRPDHNAKLTGSFSCTSDVSGQPSLDPPVLYTVTFQNTPRVSLTAGVLVSMVHRNSIALESVEDSRAGAAVTLHTEIREHPSRPQVVPFSFINVRLGKARHWNDRQVTWNLTPGIGLNPNNGGTAAELFMGGSVGLGSLFLCAGAHVGHQLVAANGFSPLDRPPSDLKTVPVDTPWTSGLAFAVSYRIPLK